MDILNPSSLSPPFSSTSSAPVVDSIASRLTAVDGATARVASSAAAYGVLCTQVEAARLAMGADQAALEEARRAVLEGLLAVGMPVAIPSLADFQYLVEPYRGGYRVVSMGTGFQVAVRLN